MNNRTAAQVDLLNGGILKSLFYFSLPILISYVFLQLYNTVDILIVGHFLKEESLAAIGSCIAAYELIVSFGTGFGNGLGIIVANAYGSGDDEKLKRTVAASCIISLAMIFFITVLSRLFLMKLLVLLGTPSEIIDEAYSYIIIIGVFSGVLFLYNFFASLLRAIGNSVMPLIFLIISSILNILFDIILITKFSMGVRGTAVATILAQSISAVLCLLYILKKSRILVFKPKHLGFDCELYKSLFAQGFSMGFMVAIVSSGSLILQSAINNLGVMIIAGHIAARKIFSVLNIPVISFGVFSATFVSQNFGAKKYERIKRGVLYSILICAVWFVLLMCTMTLFVGPAIRFLSGSENPEILDYASKYLYFGIPFYVILGILIVLRNSIQGLKYKVLPLISSVIELLGKILFTILIIPKIGKWGVIVCEPLIWCIMTVQLAYVYLRAMHRMTSGGNDVLHSS